MPYSYDPDKSGLISEGPHILTITAVEDTMSKSGNAMWVVRLEDQQRREVTDWIVQQDWAIEDRFRPLWEAAGLEWFIKAAIIDEQQLVDRQVQATIFHRHDPDWGTQARIQPGGYAKPGTGDIPADQEAFEVGEPVRTGASGIDDDIPF